MAVSYAIDLHMKRNISKIVHRQKYALLYTS